MNANKLNRFWLLAAFVLILMILISCLIIWMRLDKGQPIEISPPQPSILSGNIYVDGAINNPGLYPLKEGDSLENIIKASGGTDKNADVSRIRLYIPQTNESQSPQKININRADLWLLQALPNIGETRAQAIIDYRRQNGLFKGINEITSVPGISSSVFEKIKAYITID